MSLQITKSKSALPIGATLVFASTFLLTISPAIAQTYNPSLIANFGGAGSGTNGGAPAAGPTLDASGNLYGTTQYGGTNGVGTVWEIAKGSTTVTDLASFGGYSSGTNGAYSTSNVTIDSAGDLFGTAQGGGSKNDGVVWEIAKGSNTLVDVASFTGSNGANPLAGVTIDSSGNLFGTTYGGGTNSEGVVWEIAKGSNTITALQSFGGTLGGGNLNSPQAGVTIDSAGDLLGTCSGGTSGGGAVWEIAKGTSTITNVASFGGTGAGTNGGAPAAGVTIDTSGNLYGTTYEGGLDGDGTVWEISKGTSTITDLASFTGQSTGNNGSGPNTGVVIDSSGNLFGTTGSGGVYAAGTVWEIMKSSGTLTDISSLGAIGDGPAGITLDSAGDIYGTALEGGTNSAGTVFKLTPAGTAAPEPTVLALLLPALSPLLLPGVRRRLRIAQS